MEKMIAAMVQTKLIVVHKIQLFKYFVQFVYSFIYLDTQLIEPDKCLVEERKFLCHDHKKCIDIENVCNNKTDCLDSSDEGGICNNKTGMNLNFIK